MIYKLAQLNLRKSTSQFYPTSNSKHLSRKPIYVKRHRSWTSSTTAQIFVEFFLSFPSLIYITITISFPPSYSSTPWLLSSFHQFRVLPSGLTHHPLSSAIWGSYWTGQQDLSFVQLNLSLHLIFQQPSQTELNRSTLALSPTLLIVRPYNLSSGVSDSGNKICLRLQ